MLAYHSPSEDKLWSFWQTSDGYEVIVILTIDTKLLLRQLQWAHICESWVLTASWSFKCIVIIRRTACFVCFNELSSLHAWVLHASRPAHNFCDFPCLNTKPIYPWNTEERSHEQSKRFVTNDGLTQYEQYILWVHWFWSVLVYWCKFKWLCYLIFLAKLFNS